MSGGLAYVLDEESLFEQRCNKAMVTLQRLSDAEEITALKGLVYKHLELTESARAREILDNWARFEPLFWKVAPQPPVLPPTATPPSTVSTTPTPSGEPAKA
jgi:glutamate synthase (NADPH/NADH) large chain/glutamate synthase (ferredoxin)